MKHARRIGTIRGIPLRVHWSFGLLVALVVLASPRNPRALADAAGWVVAVFACVVIHELAHCVVARRRGLEVRDIVLLPIGGVSEIVGLDRAADDELPISLAGPGASFGLAAVLLLAALATHIAVVPPTLSTGPLLVRVLWANVLLGTFNLVPAFPLDGGRALRAFLSRRYGPIEATRRSTHVAVVIGYLMLIGGFFADWFLSIIGLFIIISARAEAASAVVRAEIGGRRVGDVAIPHPNAVSADLDIDGARRMLEHRPGLSLPVVADGRYLGMVAHDDLARSGVTTVGEVADGTAPLLDPADELWPDAVAAFRVSHRSELAVGTDGKLTGLLHECDVDALLRRRHLAASGPAVRSGR